MDKRTEIEMALANNDLIEIKEFLETGGNVYKVFDSYGYFVRETLMSRACRENKMEVVEILLEVFERDFKIAEKFVSNEEEKDFLLKYILIASSKEEIQEVLDLSKKSQQSSKKSLVFLADRQECVLVPIVEDKNLLFKLHRNGFLSINCRAENGENPGCFVGARNRLDLLKRMVAIGLNFKGFFPGSVTNYNHYFIEKIINESSSIELIEYCLSELKFNHEDLLQFTIKNQSIEVFEFLLEYICSKDHFSKADYLQEYCNKNDQFINYCLNYKNYELVAHIFTVYNVKFQLKSRFFNCFFQEPKSIDYISQILEIERDNFDDILNSLEVDTNSTVVAAIWEALDKNTLKKISKSNLNIIIYYSTQLQTSNYFHMLDPLAIYDATTENTALFIALEQNCEIPIIEHLISQGANLLHKNKEGHTTLTAGCKYSTPAIVNLLLKKVPSIINEVGPNGEYPITALISRDDSFIDIFNEMLKSGANCHVMDNENHSLLQLAVLRQRLEYVKIFLDLGIDPSLKASNGNTALHLSAYADSLDIFDLILDTGKVDIEAKNDQGNTILHCVCESVNTELFLKFVEKTKPNVNALNDAGQSPIFCCFDMVSFEKMLEMGADTSIIDENNMPFYTVVAQCNWKADILNEILSNPNIDLTITADDGCTLLHCLSDMDLPFDEYFENENFRELVRKCTNTLYSNSTAFRSASNCLELLNFMFEFGKPDLEHRNDLGETALFENLRYFL